MSKERRSNREDKKKPAMTPKEKKAARKSRKESRDSLGEHGGAKFDQAEISVGLNGEPHVEVSGYRHYFRRLCHRTLR